MFCRSAGNGKDNTRTGIGKFNEGKMAAFMRAKILYFMVNLIQINLSKMTDGNIVTSMTDWVLPLGLAGISLNPLMELG